MIRAIDLGTTRFKSGDYYLDDSTLRAIAVGGHGPSLVLVDEAGEVIMHSPWYERDFAQEVAYLEKLTGQHWDGQYFLPKLIWLRKHDPQTFARIKWVLGEYEHLAYSLTGQAYTVLPTSDWQQAFWTPELLQQLGMPLEIFPPFVSPGSYVGLSLPEALRPSQHRVFAATELPEGVPVFLSGPDFITAIVGTDTMLAGRSCLRAGSSYGLNVCSDRPIEISGAFCKAHLKDGLYTISAVFSGGGNLALWVRDSFMPELSFDDFIAVLEQVDAAGVSFEAAWGGSRYPDWDSSKLPKFSGVVATTTKEQLAKAVLCGIQQQVVDAYFRLKDAGLEIKDMRVTGGMDIAWLNAYIADRIDIPVISSDGASAELLGSAALAHKALQAKNGIYKG